MATKLNERAIARLDQTPDVTSVHDENKKK